MQLFNQYCTVSTATYDNRSESNATRDDIFTALLYVDSNPEQKKENSEAHEH